MTFRTLVFIEFRYLFSFQKKHLDTQTGRNTAKLQKLMHKSDSLVHSGTEQQRYCAAT